MPQWFPNPPPSTSTPPPRSSPSPAADWVGHALACQCRNGFQIRRSQLPRRRRSVRLTCSTEAACRFVLQFIPIFARRDDFVGQVGNLRPIGNRPACSATNSGPSPAPKRPAALWGRLATCGRLSIGLFAQPRASFWWGIALACQCRNRPKIRRSQLPRRRRGVRLHLLHRSGSRQCTTIHSNLRAPRRFYTTSSKSLKRCGAGWQPAADWQSACRQRL
jgi:hypothetical protein